MFLAAGVAAGPHGPDVLIHSFPPLLLHVRDLKELAPGHMRTPRGEWADANGEGVLLTNPVLGVGRLSPFLVLGNHR